MIHSPVTQRELGFLLSGASILSEEFPQYELAAFLILNIHYTRKRWHIELLSLLQQAVCIIQILQGRKDRMLGAATLDKDLVRKTGERTQKLKSLLVRSEIFLVEKRIPVQNH